MKNCIVHIGTAKTGTTSLQQTLRHHLSDPRFHWLSGNGLDGPFELPVLFMEDPFDNPSFRRWQVSKKQLEKWSHRVRRKLDRGLVDAAASGATPILST